jgi:hypothetical protein
VKLLVTLAMERELYIVSEEAISIDDEYGYLPSH